jgi:Domain of unknown function (DUF4839)
MHALRLAIASIVILGLAGCGSEEAAVMPDVTDQRLDVALSDIERAGINDDVDVVGGGLFGVLDKSNWQVCEQLPAAGAAVTEAPRLTVDRSCGEDAAKAGDEPSKEPTQAPEEFEPSPVDSEAGGSLTVENNEDFAALLASGKQDLDAHEAFAAKYEGKTIEFDGTIVFAMPHGDYNTRFDFLIYRGDYEDSHTTGPSFGFIDVNYSDFNLTGPNVPDSVSEGQNLHFVATVEAFDVGNGNLIRLDPVLTETR